MANVTTIVLTGGPCGGKSTSLARIEQELSDKGYKVFIIDEMATNIINSGAGPKTVGEYAFQGLMIKLQKTRNEAYIEMAKNYSEETGNDVVIVFDRGIADSKAFICEESYNEILDSNNLTNTQVLDYYDGVFNLVTAAIGAPEAYTLENNKARTETPEQAAEKDKGCIKAWTGHNHLRVIGNEDRTFTQKIDYLMEEVYSMLGIPVPVEIERKYLIEMPNMEEIKSKYDCTTVEIMQTYLVEKEPGVERRIRQRGIDGSYTFYYTEKKKISDIARTEVEHKINEKEYLSLLMEADTSLHTIIKKRTCFVYDNNYIELDTYPFWADKAIVEVELTNENKEVKLPSELKVIKEVTEDTRYKNGSLAKTLGKIE